jgi:hypothetical protein
VKEVFENSRFIIVECIYICARAEGMGGTDVVETSAGLVPGNGRYVMSLILGEVISDPVLHFVCILLTSTLRIFLHLGTWQINGKSKKEEDAIPR